MTIRKLHDRLSNSSTIEHNRCPSTSKLRKILREDFQLRFRISNAAKIKYNDVNYDEKRVWVSRLLAQFMFSGVVIISIDESSFK